MINVPGDHFLKVDKFSDNSLCLKTKIPITYLVPCVLAQMIIWGIILYRRNHPIFIFSVICSFLFLILLSVLGYLLIFRNSQIKFEREGKIYLSFSKNKIEITAEHKFQVLEKNEKNSDLCHTELYLISNYNKKELILKINDVLNKNSPLIEFLELSKIPTVFLYER